MASFFYPCSLHRASSKMKNAQWGFKFDLDLEKILIFMIIDVKISEKIKNIFFLFYLKITEKNLKYIFQFLLILCLFYANLCPKSYLPTDGQSEAIVTNLTKI